MARKIERIDTKEKEVDEKFREKHKGFQPIFGCPDHIRAVEILGSIQKTTKGIRRAYDTDTTIIKLRNELTRLKSFFMFYLKQVEDKL